MRLFIAINFSDNVKAAVSKARDELREHSIRGSFSLDEHLHLTLVFLGECDNRQTDAVKAVMKETVFNPFTLSLDKAGCFKREGGDTWWLGLSRSEALLALQANLSARLQNAGFVLENRIYTPHITLGRRVKMRTDFVPPKFEQLDFSVSSIELMRSEHKNGKLTYTPIYSKNATM